MSRWTRDGTVWSLGVVFQGCCPERRIRFARVASIVRWRSARAAPEYAMARTWLNLAGLQCSISYCQAPGGEWSRGGLSAQLESTIALFGVEGHDCTPELTASSASSTLLCRQTCQPVHSCSARILFRVHMLLRRGRCNLNPSGVWAPASQVYCPPLSASAVSALMIEDARVHVEFGERAIFQIPARQFSLYRCGYSRHSDPSRLSPSSTGRTRLYTQKRGRPLRFSSTSRSPAWPLRGCACKSAQRGERFIVANNSHLPFSTARPMCQSSLHFAPSFEICDNTRPFSSAYSTFHCMSQFPSCPERDGDAGDGLCLRECRSLPLSRLRSPQVPPLRPPRPINALTQLSPCSAEPPTTERARRSPGPVRIGSGSPDRVSRESVPCPERLLERARLALRPNPARLHSVIARLHKKPSRVESSTFSELCCFLFLMVAI